MIIIPIGRIYANQQKASEVANALVERGFPSGNVFSLTAADRSDIDDETTANTIVSGVISEIQYHESIIYARHLTGDATLVVCSAEFGYGELATHIMKQGEPMDVGPIKTLSKRRPSPFSDMLGMPTLTRSQPMSGTGPFGMSRLTDGKPMFGALVDNDMTFSSRIGMSLLRSDAAPLSTRFGLPTLMRNSTPLSSRIGMPVLSKKRSRSQGDTDL